MRLFRLSLPFLALMLAWVMPAGAPVGEAAAAGACSGAKRVICLGGKGGGGSGPAANCLLSQVGVAILAQAGSCIKVQ